MNPWLDDGDLRLYHGDVTDLLRELPDGSVDCVVTSPPYWGLRDYGTPGQLGLEETPSLFVANMVAVFQQVRRVLAPHGTCWVNLGDSFGDKQLVGIPWHVAFALQQDGWYLRSDIIWAKPNPMPESVTDRPTKSHEYVFLLTKQPRYWFDQEAVREPHWHQDPHKAQRYAAQVAQHKRRPPTRTGDGETSSFLKGGYNDDRFSENPAGRNIRSVWEMDDPDGIGNAELERCNEVSPDGLMLCDREPRHPGSHVNWRGAEWKYSPEPQGEPNVRTVWNIATQPYPEAHFATFPEELARRCILAGCPTRVCRACGKPSERIVDRESVSRPDLPRDHPEWRPARYDNGKAGDPQAPGPGQRFSNVETLGWSDCGHNNWRPGQVLDPFAGSGTTLKVARDHQRHAIGIDLSLEYLQLAARRLQQLSLLT